jgi:hypothetical protein
MKVNGQLNTLSTLFPKKEVPIVQWVLGWMVPRAGLTIVAERKPPAPAWTQMLAPSPQPDALSTNQYEMIFYNVFGYNT